MSVTLASLPLTILITKRIPEPIVILAAGVVGVFIHAKVG